MVFSASDSAETERHFSSATSPVEKTSPIRRLPRFQAVVKRIGSTFTAKTVSKTTEKDFLKAFLKKFDADEVEVLRKVYKELSARNPGSGIDKATFLQYFPLPGLWGERLFQRFDYKGLGSVDYEEFLVGISVCCRGTKCEKIHVLFQVFDLNGDGVLQKNELVTMLSNLPNLDRYINIVSSNGTTNQTSAVSVGQSAPSRSDSLVKRSVQDEMKLSQKLESLICAEEENSKFSTNEKFLIEYRDEEEDEEEGEEEEEKEEINHYDYGSETNTHNNYEDHMSKVSSSASTRYQKTVSSNKQVEETDSSSILAQNSVETENTIDIEAFVDKIIEECEYSESDSLTFIEFKTWLEKNGSILTMFSDCLHEEAWGLQGNALYRRSMVSKNTKEGRLKRLNILRDSRGSERRKRTVIDIRPDAFYKVKRLFTDPARSTLQFLNNVDQHKTFEKEKDYNNKILTGHTCSLSAFEDLYEDVSGPENSTVEIYPRQTRDILNIQLLESIRASNPDIDVSSLRYAHNKTDGELICCFSCGSLLVVCPLCNSRFPELRLCNGTVVVECRKCVEGKSKQFSKCWHCNWSFSEAIQHVDHCEPSCEGALYKIGRHMFNWRKRYFVLVDNLLYYYSSKEDTKPKGFIFLEGCFVEKMNRRTDQSTTAESILTTLGSTSNPQPSSGKYGFSIIHGAGKIPKRDLYASNEKERQLWITSLRNAMKQQDIERVYEIENVVGQGKFSVVHRAISRDSQRDVAIKIIDKSKIDGHEAELLRSEIAILRLLRHSHVIRFREILDTRSTIHIVMEYVAGGELYDLLQQKRRLPELHVNRIVFQLLATVAYLHKCGIIHRDLKPENILLTNNTIDADIKITDFGLSCICGPNERMTQPCGTLAYVAPEVLTLQGYQHKVDVWSVGVIMYLLLRGRLPFPVGRLKPSGLYYKPLNFDGPVWNNVCSSAKDLLKKLLQPIPEKRISAHDALEHIWIKNPTAVISEDVADVDGTSGGTRNSHDNNQRETTTGPINKDLLDMSAATFAMPTPPPRNLGSPNGGSPS